MATGATSTIHSLSGSGEHEAWFPLNVLVIATNRSCLLARMLLGFAGFQRQPSFGLLQDLSYLEACKSRSASGIQLEITTFRKPPLFPLFLALLFFSEDKKKIFVVSCVVGFYRSQSQLIAAQALQALAKVQHVGLCCEVAGFCGEACDRL